MADNGWYLQIMGAEVGPFTSSQLKEKAASGQVTRDMLVRRAGSTTWIPASKIKGLFVDELVHAQTPPEPPSQVEPFPTSQAEVSSIGRSNPYAVTLSSSRGGAVKTPRKYPALEFYAGLLKALAITAVILGVLAILFFLVVGLRESLIASLGICLVVVIYTAIIAFALLLASELIKMSLDVAADIKHIADQQ